MIRARVLGIGAFLPANIVTNDDMAKRVDTSDEWIRSRTGIGARRIASRMTMHERRDMAHRAAARRSGQAVPGTGILSSRIASDSGRRPRRAVIGGSGDGNSQRGAEDPGQDEPSGQSRQKLRQIDEACPVVDRRMADGTDPESATVREPSARLPIRNTGRPVHRSVSHHREGGRPSH